MRVPIAITILLGLGQLAAAMDVPLPRERPMRLEERFGAFPRPVVPAIAPTSLAPAPELQGVPLTRLGPSACEVRLEEIAIHTAVPVIGGPAPCGATDVVRIQAVKVPGQAAIALNPPAILRCSLAESIAHWVREDLVPAAAMLNSRLVSIVNYDSYSCRGRNRIVGAKLSEHGRANALDIRALKLASGVMIEPTDPHAPKKFRDAMRQSACARFMTVLGPGSDGYHESHIHVDLAERIRGYRLCRWQVHEPSGMAEVPLPLPRPLARARAEPR